MFRPTFKVDGTLTNDKAQLQLELDFRVNDGPTLMAYRIQADGSGVSIWDDGYQVPPGLTVTTNPVTGAAEISFDVTFDFGTAFDLTTALYAGAVPGGSTTSGTVAFSNTAKLTGISIIQGVNTLNDWSIQSGSGTAYSALGVVVPLPMSFLLFGSGILGLLGLTRRRPR